MSFGVNLCDEFIRMDAILDVIGVGSSIRWRRCGQQLSGRAVEMTSSALVRRLGQKDDDGHGENEHHE